jgi:hypothetical protein
MRYGCVMLVVSLVQVRHTVLVVALVSWFHAVHTGEALVLVSVPAQDVHAVLVPV